LRNKLSFFIIINLILSLYIIPIAVSQDAGQVMGQDAGEEENQQIGDEKEQTRRELEDKLRKRMEELKSKAKSLATTPSKDQPAGSGEPAPAGAKEQKPESQKSGAEEAVTHEPEKELVPAPQAAKTEIAAGTVSFFFDDADIFEVAQTIFGEVLKVNYIIDPRVKGRVNFRTVTPIPVDEVLPIMEIIMRLNGVGFVEERGIYNIIPLDEVSKELVYAQVGKPPENVAIELFAFKNLDLKDSMLDIENALGLNIKGGMVRIMPIYRLNALIVVASSKEQLEYIKKWVEVFDDMFLTARPKIFVYPLQNSKAEHIASLLQSIFSGGSSVISSAPSSEMTKKTTTTTSKTPAAPKSGASAAVGGGTGSLISPETKVFADEITNSLIILATPSDYEFVKETIQKIDVMPRQVVIEGLIARVDLTDNLSFGFAWSLKTDINITDFKPFKRDINLGGGISSQPSGTTLSDSGAGEGFTFVATDPSGIVRARLIAALKDSKAKILAAPHILVSDNREASIQVGSQVPLATSTTSTPIVGTTTTTTLASYSTIQYKDIGIILKVKPQVNDSGLVSLEISQEVSSLGDNVKIADQSYASINKTEATTNLVAQDGETIVIGGLIREDVTKSKNGIPLLSDIPIIGNLFSYINDITTRTELIILLTPHVMRNQQEARGVTTDYVNKYKDTSKDKDINKFIKEKEQKQNGSGNAETEDAE
jgi:type II secretion system protein D